jgi:hypothetical protein
MPAPETVQTPETGDQAVSEKAPEIPKPVEKPGPETPALVEKPAPETVQTPETGEQAVSDKAQEIPKPVEKPAPETVGTLETGEKLP